MKKLAKKLDSFRRCHRIYLNGNTIRMDALQKICEESLRKFNNPFVSMKCLWTYAENKQYCRYCRYKNNKEEDGCIQFLSYLLYYPTYFLIISILILSI